MIGDNFSAEGFMPGLTSPTGPVWAWKERLHALGENTDLSHILGPASGVTSRGKIIRGHGYNAVDRTKLQVTKWDGQDLSVQGNVFEGRNRNRIPSNVPATIEVDERLIESLRRDTSFLEQLREAEKQVSELLKGTTATPAWVEQLKQLLEDNSDLNRQVTSLSRDIPATTGLGEGVRGIAVALAVISATSAPAWLDGKFDANDVSPTGVYAAAQAQKRHEEEQQKEKEEKSKKKKSKGRNPDDDSENDDEDDEKESDPVQEP